MYQNLFRNRNFTLLALGGFVSSIGDYLYNIGVTVFLYSMTKSVSSVAIMWLSRAVLRIPMLYVSGIFADTCNKKKVIMYTNLASVLFAFLFILANEKRLWLVYILAFLLQTLNDIDVSAETAILPDLVSKEHLPHANSVFSFLESTCVFLSPALGGILYKLYGSNVLFIINAFSFLVANLLFTLIKYNPVKAEISPEKSGMLSSGMEGLKVLSKYSNVKTVFAIMCAFAVLGRFYETYKVAVSDIMLKMKPEGIIYFDYALAIGGLSVPFMVKALSKRNHIFMFTFSTLCTAIGYSIFGYSRSFIITFVILIFLGLVQSLQGIYSRTIIQHNIPKEYIGRVFSFYKILITFFAIIGLVIAGPLYDMLGVGMTFLLGSASLILCCSVYMATKLLAPVFFKS